MEILIQYWSISTLICFLASMRLPSKTTPFYHFVASLVVSLFVGYVAWPFAVIAIFIDRRKH